eukprot:4123795-Amphidinium_carterae.1
MTGDVSPDAARRHSEDSQPTVPSIQLAVDNKGVYQSITSKVDKHPAEKNVLVQVHWLRQELRQRRLHDFVWSDTRSMAADGMTKGSVSREAIHQAMEGVYHLLQPAESAIRELNLTTTSASSSASAPSQSTADYFVNLCREDLCLADRSEQDPCTMLNTSIVKGEITADKKADLARAS